MKKIIICFVFVLQYWMLSAQSIGIGTNSPSSSALLHLNSTTKGFLMPRMSITERNAIALPAEGLLIYNLTTNQLNQRQNAAWKILLNNDSWTGGGSGQIFNIGDNVGINTAGPGERLDVSGNIRSNSAIIIDNTTAILQLKSAGISTGFVQLSGDNIRLGTNGGNTGGEVIIGMDGTDMVNFKKTISAGTSIQMNVNGVSTGVLQTTSTGNVSLTAVNANTQVQLGGEIFINNTANRTGIGTSSPTERLHVVGKLKVSGTEMTMEDGRITGTATGSAYNLLPLAYGRVTDAGNKAGGSQNFTSVARTGEGRYDINVTGLTTSSVIIISANESISAFYSFNAAAGRFSITAYDPTESSFSPKDASFHFVIYNP